MQAAPSYPIASLYVGDLHPDINEASLFEKFSQAGPVVSIRVCRDVITRRSLGYAYVKFQQPADAERALDTMNFDNLKGRPMCILWSHDSSLRKSGVGNIFIKNLDKSIDSKALYNTFSTFGNILFCKVVLDEHGQSKGYGFVHFETQESADMAIEKVNGMLLNENKVFVGIFIARKERLCEIGHSARKKRLCKMDHNQRYTNVYIKNFGDDFTDELLTKTFEKFGPVVSAVVMIDHHTGKSRGFGFVSYKAHEAASMSVDQMNGASVNGRTLYVGRAQKRKERMMELQRKYEADRMERYTKYQGVNLYVKNLEDDFDDERLRKEFTKFGNITSAKVMGDKTGRSRGFGFVCFSSPEEATEAITQMNGRIVVSKRLYVALAQRREERQAHLAALRMQRITSRGGGMQNQMQMQMYPTMYGLTQSQCAYFPHMTAGFRPWQNAPMPNRPYGFMPRGNRPNIPRGQMGMGAGASRMTNPSGAGGRMGGSQRMQQQIPSQQGVRGMKMSSQVRNPSAAVAASSQPPVQQPSAPQAQQGGSGNTVLNDLLHTLTTSPPQQQKQVIGEHLYRQIYNLHNDLAGKITGMLLEMDNSELLHMLEVPESLKSKLEEAVSVLQEHQSLGTVPMVLNDLLRTLTSAPPRQQKQIIRDHLYRQIYNLHNDLAGKITGMLLEMDNSELLHMLEVPESLKSKVEEAVSVLQEHQSLGTVPMVLNDLLRTLTSAPPQQQKQIIGEHLYRQIYNLHNDLAGKITGMLLEMDNSELLHMLEVPESLKSKVEEVVSVLQEHQSLGTVPNTIPIPL